MPMRNWTLLALALAACGPAQVGDPRSAPPPGSGPIEMAPPPEGCEVSFDVTVSAEGDVAMSLRNFTDHAIDFELPGNCPNGPLYLDGLPDGYDLYSGCTKGMCADDPPVAVHLDPGATASVAYASIAIEGAGCQPALEAGTHELRVRIPDGLPFAACAAPTTLEVAAASTAAPGPGQCATSADCMVYCPSAQGCCSSAPCGCQSAILKADKAAVDAAFAKSCDKAPSCLDVACRLDEAMFAECVSGQCVARDQW